MKGIGVLLHITSVFIITVRKLLKYLSFLVPRLTISNYLNKTSTSTTILFSIFEILLTISRKQPDLLIRTDFTANTCLLFSKVFEYIFTNIDNKDQLNTENWLNILKLYLTIQTSLLEHFKYNYLKNSILLMGSYYEHMIQVCV
jgi:hypothetical protein